MSNAMHVIMNEFDEYRNLHLEGGNYEAAHAYDSFISYANNCHGKNAVATFDYVRNLLESLASKSNVDKSENHVISSTAKEALEVLKALENHLKAKESK